ncbi:hypothetical protein XELAEV_18040953mg [Xenopus laevis]|uniref:Uncharacterized protein n=1 Tax=Xenopus laevis TaxID=8355 RepID=A0A974CAD9_XENLA|nr:hypothetical protein XELAEV_18040953mg [Xenopus laevis]
MSPLSVALSGGLKFRVWQSGTALQLASKVEPEPQTLDMASILRCLGISGVMTIRLLYWFFSLFRHREWS